MRRLLLVLACCWIGAAAAEGTKYRLKLGAAPPSTPTPTTPPLTLRAVLKAAVESFPGLLAAQQRVEAAAGDKLAAEGGFDTNLRLLSRWSVAGLYQNQNYDVAIEQPTPLWGTSFFTGWRRGIGNYPVYEGKSMTATDGEVRAGVNIPLWRNGPIDRRRATLAQAELGQLIASHEFDAQLLELQRIAAQRYWDWVLAGRRLAIARDLLNIAKTRDQELRERILLGEIPAFEGTENQRAILERQERVVAAERILEQTAIQLSLYWRDSQGEPQLPKPEQLPAGFPELGPMLTRELQSAIEEAWQRRPELKRLEQQRKQAEIERDLARNQINPAVDLSLSGAQDFGISPSYLVNRQEMYAGVVFDLPLQQRVAKGRTQSAEAGIQRIAADYRLAADRIAAEVKDALSAVDAAYRRVGIVRAQLETARQLAEGEWTRFDLGESTLLFVDLRELAKGDASVTEAEALNAYFKASADFRAAMGHLDLAELVPTH